MSERDFLKLVRELLIGWQRVSGRTGGLVANIVTAVEQEMQRGEICSVCHQRKGDSK